MQNKEKCQHCDSIAIWCQLSASANNNPYYCDNCVPRGCTCNNHHIEEFPEMLIEYKITNRPYRIEDGFLIPLDDKNREYPCVEYHYDEEGFDIEG